MNVLEARKRKMLTAMFGRELADAILGRKDAQGRV